MAATASTPIDCKGSFKTASELRSYLVRHPDAVRALQTRTVWSRNHGLEAEFNPLLELAKVNPNARLGQKDWGKYSSPCRLKASPRPSSIDLRILCPEDPQEAREASVYNTALQMFAANAVPRATQMLSLILAAGADYDETVKFYDKNGADQGWLNAIEVVRSVGNDNHKGTICKLIDAHAKKASQKGAIITSLTDRINQLPKLQQRLTNSKRKIETMKQKEAAYMAKKAESSVRKADLQRQIAVLEEEIESLEEEDKRDDDAYYEDKEDAVENGDYLFPAGIAKLEAEIKEVTDLVAAIQGATAMDMDVPE